MVRKSLVYFFWKEVCLEAGSLRGELVRQKAMALILFLFVCFFLLLQLPQGRQEDDRFATIRPQKMIAEQRQENEMRDQLEIYKKLRQSHQKEVLILESRLHAEMNEHRRTLDKEYDTQVCTVKRERVSPFKLYNGLTNDSQCFATSKAARRSSWQKGCKTG